MEQQIQTNENTINIKQIEQEVNVCFESISQTKYKMLRAREDVKHFQGQLKLYEGKIKFIRETEIPIIQDSIKTMQNGIMALEKELKIVINYKKDDHEIHN